MKNYLNSLAVNVHNLNGWRGVLALVVFFCHCYQIYFLPLYSNVGIAAFCASFLSNIAVVYFIILSGFVIGYSEEKKKKGFQWKTYIFNRFTRIYPSYLAVLLLCVTLYFIFPIVNGGSRNFELLPSYKFVVRTAFNFNLSEIGRAVLMLITDVLQVNGPLWSLVLEWWLYASGLLVLLATRDKRWFCKFIFGLLTIAPLYYIYTIFGFIGLFYITIWFTGFYYQKIPIFVQKLFALTGGLFMAFTIFKYLDNFEGFYRGGGNWFNTFQAVSAFVFLFVALRFKVADLFFRISIFSYTLYVLHFPILLFVFGLMCKYLHISFFWSVVALLIEIPAIILLAKWIARFTEDKEYIRGVIQKYSWRSTPQ